MGHREELLAAAKRLLAEKGFAHITARDLVAESGTNLASIGYHFGSKEALLNAAIISSFDDWDSHIDAAMQSRAGDTPLDRLEAFLAGLQDGQKDNRSITVASLQALAQFEYAPQLRDDLARTYERGRRELAGLVLDRDPSEIDDETARTVGSMTLCLVNGMVLQLLIDPEAAPSAADLAAALRRLAQPDETGGGRSRVDAR
ncbi:TetR/AcrR family transcriptional regulator [Jiangella sp. DSM 45060]|uniref:TetR/AcrR family transcriptional regulator n=1 Tax=Jiangella sp. DSM 45060 TaxID=1798224 RepID=UPI000879BBD6|nr:TetR/AcrR family transcriptional regulator [Jiangella sp. DSM 45060]SDT51973.1 DNA-binding transcriptional regulator, AcrR family [Jiangella sp. DSM 45060]